MVKDRSSKRAEEGERLKAARKAVGLSQYAVAQNIGVNREVVSRWESGLVWPTLDHLKELVNLYGVSVDWVLGNERRVAETRRPVYTVGPPEEIPLRSVPIVGTISADGLVEGWQEVSGSLELPSSLLREAPRSFGLRVSGDSLSSEQIFDGIIVVVDPDAAFVDGKIYAVTVDGEVAARRVFAVGEQLKIVTGDGSEDEYPRSRVGVIGRVRWSLKEY